MRSPAPGPAYGPVPTPPPEPDDPPRRGRRGAGPRHAAPIPNQPAPYPAAQPASAPRHAQDAGPAQASQANPYAGQGFGQSGPFPAPVQQAAPPGGLAAYGRQAQPASGWPEAVGQAGLYAAPVQAAAPSVGYDGAPPRNRTREDTGYGDPYPGTREAAPRQASAYQGFRQEPVGRGAPAPGTRQALPRTDGPHDGRRRPEPAPDWPEETGRGRHKALLVTVPVVLGALACAGGAYMLWPRPGAAAGSQPATSPATSPAGASPSGSPSVTQAQTYAKTGPGTFATAAGGTAKAGHGGKLIRYKVQVENKIGMDAATFAEQVDTILAAPRGWTTAGKWSFQRVSSGKANFVVRLASVKTSAKLCKKGGLDTDGNTNCSIPGDVVMDTKRWVLLNPYYQGKTDLYHALAINHEVGHALGFHHTTCPAKGKPAPVMMQQMFGLKGCVINAWPYSASGKFITGPPVKRQ